MLKVMINGNVATAPKVVNGDNGSIKLVSFSIANDDRRDSESKPVVQYFNCVAFGKTAERIATMQVGDPILITEATLSNGSYDKDGVKHYTTDIVVIRFEYAETKAAHDARVAAKAAKAAQAQVPGQAPATQQYAPAPAPMPMPAPAPAPQGYAYPQASMPVPAPAPAPMPAPMPSPADFMAGMTGYTGPDMELPFNV